MKTDNADFKKRMEEARERVKKLDELRVAVIKWHLLVEEALDTFLAASLYNPGYLSIDRMNFHLKGNLALALSLKGDKDALWAVFWALNQLRNKIAHKVDSTDEIDEKMKYLRKTYIGALLSNQTADAEKRTDAEIVEDASILIMGLIGQLALDARDRQGIIDQQWKSRSE
jgi:hypothetical protein